MKSVATVILFALICLGLVAKVLNARVLADEAQGCKDKGELRAYMARLPGEPHSAEGCVYVRPFGDPSWVPTLGDPTIVGVGIKGKPGLELQLGWVRDECRRLAKQLNRRC